MILTPPCLIPPLLTLLFLAHLALLSPTSHHPITTAHTHSVVRPLLLLLLLLYCRCVQSE